MATAAPSSTCHTHPKREAITGCGVCEARLCGECVVRTPVGFKCLACTGGGAAKHGLPGRRSNGRLAVLAGVALVLAAAAGFALGRGDDEPDARPVTVPDRVGREFTLQFAGDGNVRIGATLAVPEAARDRTVPGALVIPGFGPTNRDGIAPAGAAADQLYRDLAHALDGHGVASLRYDKRGTGESVLTDEALDFDAMVADAAAGLSFLEERVEVDGDALVVVGHDEGGLIALELAARDPRVRAAVLVSTPGRPLLEVLADDLAASAADPETAEALVEELRGVVGTLLDTGHGPDPGELSPALQPAFPSGEDRYLEAIFSFDPNVTAADVTVPVLLVRGARAPGVGPQDEANLAAALGGDVTVAVGAEAGHTLRLPAPAGDGGEQTTGDMAHDREFHGGAQPAGMRDEALLEELAAWVARLFG